ncbi:S8 family peptidase [Janthinobacterium sp. TB1-E2]|uniref:S8 family peptidase n=1 Tax=Janthinobacterium aestuarii TaxID=2985511 RepID=A0ABZ2GPZ1_9BURK
MAEQYKHIKITKEKLENDRRTRDYNIPTFKRGDLAGHGQKLNQALGNAFAQAKKQVSSVEDRFILKLEYTGMLDIKNLIKHGVEFISQEGNNICIVFANEAGLAKFSDHLSRLGKNDANITYKQILTALENVDNWTRSDRESWAVKFYGLPKNDTFRLDIELWPVQSSRHPLRQKLIQDFTAWLRANHIRQIDQVSLDSLIMYRVEVTLAQADLLLEHTDIRYVDLLPKSGINYSQMNFDIAKLPGEISAPAENSARVCILDSGINTNHPLLRSAIAENTSFVTGEEAEDDAGHGTAVAGIALYGDLEAAAASNYWKPEFWLYSGKILSRDKDTGETKYDEKTIESTLEKAVAYFAGEQGCRIFNLSIGNTNSPYDGFHVKGIAYILDKLAREYDVLFIVSAGNFNGCEEPPIPKESWREEYPSYLSCPESIIIDPAPALNAITVGSLARHNAHENEQKYPEIHALTPAGERQPSPFTRHGPSVKGAIKPDLVATGGNIASPMRTEGKQWQAEARGMGVLCLNHEFIGRTLFKEISGTSFAAPYITHLAARLLNEYPTASANLLRAMLVNQASIPNESVGIFTKNHIDSHKEENKSDLQRDVMGYGAIDTDALFRSSESAVVLHSENTIKNNTHQFFELPLPEHFLRSQRAKRELRVSLAHSPAVRTTRLDYVATKIFFKLVKGKSLADVERSFNHDLQDETKVRNDDAVTNREITSQARSKGTVQASIWSFKQLSPNVKWFVVVTRQDRPDWGAQMSLEEEAYALAITITDRENIEPQLYTQIQNRVQIQERERARA